ncbi:MAG: SPOR domain-containing protein [Myxococcales bacterium]|jgi:DedD protein|nr:SPOR domain-containing protein [Myxococcales bacterium]
MQTGPVNLRNLERIQETDSRGSRFAALLLAATGVAALTVVGLTMGRRDPEPARADREPLAALIAEARADGERGRDPTELQGKEVTFPAVLSDDEDATTALVAVKDAQGRLIEQEPAEVTPPAATDKLPVVPLPAGTLLNATPVTTEPKDDLTRMAMAASDLEDAPMADPGMEGGYLVQVASFQKQEDADRFVEDLRRRGHPAFRQAANVPGRGLWHRVRVGSFKTKYAATLYQRKLEKSERISALVIDPDKVEQQQKIRAAKLAARIEKYGRP